MFIRHCPDAELSLIFRCKPLQQWIAAEVYEKLVEQRRDKRHTSQPKSATAVTVLRQDVSPAIPPSLPAGKPTSDSNTSPALGQPSQGSAEPLGHVISMFECILEQGPQQARDYGRPEHQSQRVAPYDGLFHTKVFVGDKVEVNAVLDSSSLAGSLSSRVLQQLLQEGVMKSLSLEPMVVVLIGNQRTGQVLLFRHTACTNLHTR